MDSPVGWSIPLKSHGMGNSIINWIEQWLTDRRQRRKVVASRHLICGNCSNWIQFDSSGCTISWAEMRESTSVFTCKGCTEVARLVGEVEDLRKMMESLKRMVTGQGLEEKRGETGDQEATLEEAEEKEKEKSVGEKTRENSSTDNKDGKRIRPGAQMLATYDYKKNPESPVGNELDVNEGDTLVYLMPNEDNEHWLLVEDGKGQVGYVPATYLNIIRDVTRQEEESDTARKEGYGKKTDGTKIGGRGMGQDGERRKTYSAAVIEGFKRNSEIYVGDSIVRKTDSRLNKGEDVVVCLPGARIEHVTARVEKIMGRGKGGTILVHIGTNNADKEGTTAIVDKYSKLLKKTKEARVGQIILSGILPVFGNRIDGYRNSKRMAINGMVKRLCKEEDVGYVNLWDSFVGKEEMYARDGLHLSGKGMPFLPRDC